MVGGMGHTHDPYTYTAVPTIAGQHSTGTGAWSGGK